MPAVASRILALDASLAVCSAAVLIEGRLAAERIEAAGRGQVQRLAPMAEFVLDRAGVAAAALDLVAVCTGPGSFTGLRAALALAHGVALAAGVTLAGVTLREVFAAGLPELPGRALWVAVDSRRGRIFLDRGAGFTAVDLDAVSLPDGAVALAGDAAVALAARLTAEGVDALATEARQPRARDVALAARAQLAGGARREAVLPLYVDPPALRPPPR